MNTLKEEDGTETGQPQAAKCLLLRTYMRALRLAVKLSSKQWIVYI